MCSSIDDLNDGRSVTLTTEKTFTLTELVTNLREAAVSGLLASARIPEDDAAAGLAVALGYPITDEGYQQFDADLTAVGL